MVKYGKYQDKYLNAQVIGVAVSFFSMLWVWILTRSELLREMFVNNFLLFSLACFFIVTTTGVGLSLFLVDVFGKKKNILGDSYEKE